MWAQVKVNPLVWALINIRGADFPSVAMVTKAVRRGIDDRGTGVQCLSQ